MPGLADGTGLLADGPLPPGGWVRLPHGYGNHTQLRGQTPWKHHPPQTSTVLASNKYRSHDE